MKKFNVLVADPPWKFSDGTRRGGAEKHYPCLRAWEIQRFPLPPISDNAYQVGYGAGEYAGSTFAKDEPINIGAIPGKLGNTTAESRTGGMVGGVIAARQKALGTFICKEDAILTGFKLWEP